MAVPNDQLNHSQLNRFERALFWTALVLGGLVVAIRLCAVALAWYLHHPR